MTRVLVRHPGLLGERQAALHGEEVGELQVGMQEEDAAAHRHDSPLRRVFLARRRGLGVPFLVDRQFIGKGLQLVRRNALRDVFERPFGQRDLLLRSPRRRIDRELFRLHRPHGGQN